MDIIAELEAFDGRHTNSLESVAARLAPTDPVINELCTLAEMNDARIQTATTWLLKRFQEDGVVLSHAQVENCLTLLGQVSHWEAKLHLLQMLPEFAIPSKQKNVLKILFEEFLNDDNKFVRAWSYNGLFVLADQYPEFRIEVFHQLKRAQEEEAASVRARIRNIFKTAKWDDLA